MTKTISAFVLASLILFAGAVPSYASETCQSDTWVVFINNQNLSEKDDVFAAFDLIGKRQDFDILNFTNFDDTLRFITIAHNGTKDSPSPESLIEALKKLKGVGVYCFINPDVPFPTFIDQKNAPK